MVRAGRGHAANAVRIITGECYYFYYCHYRLSQSLSAKRLPSEDYKRGPFLQDLNRSVRGEALIAELLVLSPLEPHKQPAQFTGFSQTCPCLFCMKKFTTARFRGSRIPHGSQRL